MPHTTLNTASASDRMQAKLKQLQAAFDAARQGRGDSM